MTATLKWRSCAELLITMVAFRPTAFLHMSVSKTVQGAFSHKEEKNESKSYVSVGVHI